ncbi:retrovirus-related pol polyprotein from transposon TNT 1-94 [Tanacetum coccineum]
MTTLADKAILSGADNRPPTLENVMYDSWKSRMELYMMNRQHERMILESVENGPLIWPSIEENGVTRPKKYSELSATEAIQADCDIKATNIILQGLPPEVYALVSNHKVAKELCERIQLLMQGTSLTKHERELNTKFLNTLPPEWSKFMTDVKLVRDLHTTNIDQLHAYLGQHEFHANKTYTPGASGSNSRKQRTAICYNCKGEGHMSKQCTKPKRKRDNSWFKDKVLLVQAQANGQILYEEELAFLADLGIAEAKVALMANLSHYGSDALVKVHNHDNVDHSMINQGMQYVTESQQAAVQNSNSSAQQDNSMNSSDPSPSCRPTKVKVPKELPKVSMVNTSLKKLKHHLAGFDVVVKEEP